ncbi:MAG: hypothetical protein ACOVOE_04060 [Caulobacter sp.]
MARGLSSFWTFLTSERLSWLRLAAVLIGVHVVSNWLQWPLKSPLAFPFLPVVVAIWGVWWLLSLERTEDVLGRFNRDEAGAWRTTRAERIRRLALLPFFVTGLFSFLVLSWELWRISDLLRVSASLLIAFGLLAATGLYAWRAWRARVELQIDKAGVFAAPWRRAYGWDEIAFAVQPSGRRELRLVLTDAAAQTAGRSALMTAPLAPTGLLPNEALAALRAVQPDLLIAPWTSNGVVLPIRGATDLPDISKVGTYG